MGISRLSAMIIQSHPDGDLLIDSMQHCVSGLFAGWLYLLRDGEIHQPILSTDPIYETASQAGQVLRDCVCELRRMGDSIFADAASAA